MNLKTMSYDELILHAEDVMKAVRQRAYAEGYGQGRFDERVEKLYEKATPAYASPQHCRDEIIEKAKRDVAELEEEVRNENEWFSFHHAHFIVNKEKRTVVVLIRDNLYKSVYLRGIAKCDPSDCFNVHIGKAIALRRALGLEVPAEYYNAPQPTEVRVGDIVEVKINDGTIERKEITRVEYEDNFVEMPGRMITDMNKAFKEEKYATIIDDSREEVSE